MSMTKRVALLESHALGGGYLVTSGGAKMFRQQSCCRQDYPNFSDRVRAETTPTPGLR